MVKECIKEMLNNTAFNEYKSKLTTLTQFEESQLEYMLNMGVTLDPYSTIILNFDKRFGFRCNNTNQHYVGKLPICNQVEKILNEKYISLINEANKESK